MKINVDASMRHSTRSASTGYVMGDNHATIIIAGSKLDGEWPILVIECLAACEVIMMAV